jgi:hypothetical protein
MSFSTFSVALFKVHFVCLFSFSVKFLSEFQMEIYHFTGDYRSYHARISLIVFEAIRKYFKKGK